MPGHGVAYFPGALRRPASALSAILVGAPPAEGQSGAKKNRILAGNSNLAAAGALITVFKPEETSPALTTEREAARQRLNDDERKMLEAIESDLVRPLTEEEEHLVLEPGALIEQVRPKNPLQ